MFITKMSEKCVFSSDNLTPPPALSRSIIMGHNLFLTLLPKKKMFLTFLLWIIMEGSMYCISRVFILLCPLC
jgi:hypothetical protein